MSLDKLNQVLKGGAGSGHHGHGGVKGKRGGSAPGKGGGDVYMPGRVGTRSAQTEQFRANMQQFRSNLSEAKQANSNASFDDKKVFGGNLSDLEKSNPKEVAQYKRGLITAEEFAGKLGRSDAYNRAEYDSLPSRTKSAVQSNKGKSSGDYFAFVGNVSGREIADAAHLVAGGMATIRDDNIVQLNSKFDKVKKYA